jgi:RsiW-degrading membrane proteinase PrsW (M82 family)
MSDLPRWHGWRSRLFYLSRNRHWLLRTACGIAAAGLLIACLVASFGGKNKGLRLPSAMVDAGTTRLQESADRLKNAASPDPRALCAWLRRVAEVLHGQQAEEPENQAELLKNAGKLITSLKLLGYDSEALIEKHADPELKSLITDYLAVAFLPEASSAEADAAAALQRLDRLAKNKPPAPYASELVGSLMLMRGEEGLALAFFMAEGAAWADAKDARATAVSIALHTENVEQLRIIRALPGGWLEDCSPHLQSRVGDLTGDIWLHWRGMLLDHFTDIPWLLVSFTLLAGVIWYFILVQHDEKSRWRWFWPLLPLLAGVFSVWPTLSLLSWQERVQGLVQGETLLEQARYFILGVGLREELCKLALFLPFLPWLLRARKPGRALLCGAFVGLGFALEENVQYYSEGGLAVAFGRLVSANFLHVCLTGLLAHSTYRLFCSRFRDVEPFFGTFAMVVLGHGIYDLLATTDVVDLGGWLSIALFLVLASRFLDDLAQETDARRSTLSLRAAFTLGCALLVAAVFIATAVQTGTLQSVAFAGNSLLSSFILVFLYWRRFEHA